MSMNSGDFLEGNQAASGRSGPPLRLIAFAAVAAVAVIFVLQNRERTSIDFLVFELRSRTWAAMATSMALGVVLDRLFLGWWRRRKAERAAAG